MATQAQRKYEGDYVEYTPSADVAVDQVVIEGALVGVTTHAIEANVLGHLAVKGVFEFATGTSTSNAFTFGALVYWDDTNNIATTTSGGNTLIGKCVKAASATATVVKVRMNQ